MLVLSRRKAEKVLFPTLGITIEVTRIQGRTVHLGIDAPAEIRIIRAELEETDGQETEKPQSDQKNRCGNSWDAPQDIQACLDAANLAIHLAQNQLRQRLNDTAEETLEHAHECLENLETATRQIVGTPSNSTLVREAKTEYFRCKKMVEQVVNEHNQQGGELTNWIDEPGDFQLTGWDAESSEVNATMASYLG